MTGDEVGTAPGSQILRNVVSIVQLVLGMQIGSEHPRRARRQSLGITGDLTTKITLECVRQKILWVLYVDDAFIVSRSSRMFESMNKQRGPMKYFAHFVYSS